MANNGQFQVRYESVDGGRTVKRFATLAKAQEYAQRMVGEHPTLGQFYAVSDDGIGKITAFQGCTLADLFPANPVVEQTEEEGDVDADAPDATEVEVDETEEAEAAHQAGYHDIQDSSICPLCTERRLERNIDEMVEDDEDEGYDNSANLTVTTEETPEPVATRPTVGNPCECGCGVLVKRRFKQGHDMKLKSRLLKEAREAARQSTEG